jgi:hypothetical protein
LPVEFLEEDSLPKIIELLDDFLDGKVGAFGQIFGLPGDKHRGMQGVMELAEGDLDRPGVDGVEACEVHQHDRPPFLGIQHAWEMRSESFEEGDLPV